MRHRFTGNHQCKVDDKGRVSIPAPFRRVLDALDGDRETGTQPRVHLLYGDHREPWLTCHSMAGIDDIADLLDDMDEGDDDLPILEAYYFTHADQLTLDPSGRLVLPAALRERAGITDTAMFSGRNKTFQISAPEAPAEAIDPLSRALAEDPDQKPIRSRLPPRRRAPARDGE